MKPNLTCPEAASFRAVACAQAFLSPGYPVLNIKLSTGLAAIEPEPFFHTFPHGCEAKAEGPS